MNQISAALKEWIPYQLIIKEDTATCKWLYLDGKPFTEPFFDSTILICKGRNQKKMQSTSSMDVLAEWVDGVDSIEPSLIIFHVSRCGSTLATQLLSLNPQNIVLSEVPFFDAILRWQNKKGSFGEPETQNLLKSVIAFYAQKRKGDENKLIIKTDSWHIFFYQQIRKLYPTTPIVLLYRRPDEVIRSHQKKSGMHAVPGIIEPELFGFDTTSIFQTPLSEYMAMVLEKYYTEFIHILKTDALAVPINYNEGANAIIEKTAKAASIIFTEKDEVEIQMRSGFHAKYPDEKFAEEPLNEDVPLYQSKAFELYTELEKIRKAKL